MADDILDVTILPDGTIKTESPGQISPANHSNADRFLKLISELTGSVPEKKKLKQGHTHTHGDQHQHEGQ